MIDGLKCCARCEEELGEYMYTIPFYSDKRFCSRDCVYYELMMDKHIKSDGFLNDVIRELMEYGDYEDNRFEVVEEEYYGEHLY